MGSRSRLCGGDSVGLTRIRTKDVPLPSRINRDASGIWSGRETHAGGADPGSERHLLQVHPETGVALLPAGLAVAAVVYADDGKIGWIHHRHGGQRPHVHEELAVAGHHQHATRRTGESQAESHRRGRAHGAGEREHVRRVPAQEGEVAGGSGKAGHDQEVLVASDKLRHRLVAVEEEFRVEGRMRSWLRRGRPVGLRGVNCRSQGEGRVTCGESIRTAWRR